MKPRKGDALLFFSMDPMNRHVDALSQHEGCPVLAGTKWSATIWMHRGQFRAQNLRPQACAAANDNCSGWAQTGECEKNPQYMQKNCRVSCRVCTPCQENDVLCQRKNIK